MDIMDIGDNYTQSDSYATFYYTDTRSILDG